MWLKDESCEKVVSKAWEDGLLSGEEFPFLMRIDLCRDRLASWNENEFGHVQTKINSLQQRLQWLEKQQSNLELVQETCRIRAELNEWLDSEEAIWSQRSHLTWLQLGDRNSAFFHARASGRFQRNHINGIFDDNQIWQEDESKIEEVFMKYYKDLFTWAQPTNFAEILDAVQPNLSVEMNNMLTSEFHGFEVSRALKQMYPTKASGPDGMPPLFSNTFGSQLVIV
ncbi:hypothetical protein ACB098_05G166700 [Castanea mollissima]